MSTTIDFKDTAIPAMFIEQIKNRFCYNMPIDFVPGVYRSMFSTITSLLKYRRDKNDPHVAFELLNIEGEFVFGAIMDFHAPEGDNDDTGNWTLSFTFNEDDTAGIKTIYNNHSDMFFALANQEMQSSMCGHFQNSECATNVYVSLIEAIKQQLDAISNDGEDKEIVMPGIFMACVGFEDGQKVFSIIPGHNIKQQIKDDKGLSLAKAA